MAETMMIRGKVETIFNDEDFARILGECLGYDAEKYFRDHWDTDFIMNTLSDDQILEYCSGECSKVQEVQEEYDSLLYEIQEELEALSEDVMNQTKSETRITIDGLVRKINSAR